MLCIAFNIIGYPGPGTKRQTMSKRYFIPILFIILVAGLISFLWSRLTKPEKESFLFPENFRGAVYVIYDQKNGEPKVYENNRRLYKIPDNGILFTQFKAEYGRIDHRYFFVDGNGKRKEVLKKEEWTPGKIQYESPGDSTVVFGLITGTMAGSTLQNSTAFHFQHLVVGTYNQTMQSENLLSFEKIDSIRAAYLGTKGARK